MSIEELETYNTVCQEAMYFGVEQAKKYAATAYDRYSGEEDAKNLELFKAEIRERYPWADDDNLGRLFSQGIYYAMK